MTDMRSAAAELPAHAMSMVVSKLSEAGVTTYNLKVKKEKEDRWLVEAFDWDESRYLLMWVQRWGDDTWELVPILSGWDEDDED